MLDDISTTDAAARLRAALSDITLPASARSYAQALAERLENGVRIVLLGPRGAGKSALCDAILGGATAVADAQTSRHFYVEGAAPTHPFASGDAHAFSLGFCPFGHAQIIDCAVPQDEHARDGILGAALDVADIVLWCTQSFDVQEAAVWARARDSLKDHSFLVLTKADMLAQQGALVPRIEALQGVVCDEFHSLFPTATPVVLAQHAQQKAVSDAQFAASGLKALVDAVSGIVAAGQRADLDSALLFLERQGLAQSQGVIVQDRSVAPSVINAVPFRAARDTIMARAYDLAELGFDEAEGDMSDVLQLCGTISEELVDVMQNQAASYPQLAPFCAAFQDASDKVMLMTLENDTGSAADAVTILLQLRRDLESMQVQ